MMVRGILPGAELPADGAVGIGQKRQVRAADGSECSGIGRLSGEYASDDEMIFAERRAEARQLRHLRHRARVRQRTEES